MPSRLIGLLLSVLAAGGAEAPLDPAPIPIFDLPRSGLELARPPRPGAFFDVVGRRSAAVGYENKGLEVWAYPLKLVDDFHLGFKVEGYPLETDARDILTKIQVRPEATLFTYSHPAYTVREIVYAPLDEPAVVVLLDVRSVLPLTLSGTFRPKLKLMWPAGLMTGDIAFKEKEHVYEITEETKRFVAVVGSPGATDVSVMPYQEEPRDVPLRFVVEVPPAAMGSRFVPIVFVGGLEGKEKAKAVYDRVLASARALYEKNAAHYAALLEGTARLSTPDPRLDTAFAWAKVGIDKGVAENPTLGTGLLAGFRTSGESERPGFAWLFGRDALWTSFALHSEGDFVTAREALDFLRKYQRADGKIPHEISQSAAFIPWFTDYEYPWKSADATPLYVVAQADHWRATGDRAHLQASWDSIVRAWRFSAATDSDGNGLIENTKVGHGWVEGGSLYPAHEEIYLEGVWIEACRSLAELAEVMQDKALAEQARAAAERTRQTVEKTYWLADRGFYAFATTVAPEKPPEAEPGPNRAARQARLDVLAQRRLIDEDTSLPAVPLWWHTLDAERAQSEIDHLGGGALATDWGTRLLSSLSQLYDPLSYHAGSVWPLFTGWASMAAYRHGRPQVGYQALMANALLTETGALGYVTELLSGEFDAPFSRSSHHQIWSEAMVVTPLVRGVLGVEASDAGQALRVAPQLPADWDHVTLSNLAVGEGRYDLAVERRRPGRETIRLERRPAAGDQRGSALPLRLGLAPAFPLDARIRSVELDGRSTPFKIVREGDVQFAEVSAASVPRGIQAVFTYDAGTEVYAHADAPERGATSQGLRVLRSRADASALLLSVEGLGGRAYPLRVRTPRSLAEANGVAAKRIGPLDWELSVSFEGPPATYVRRELRVPLR